MKKPKIILLGRGGTGKSTIQHALQELSLISSISYTTRIPRDGEIDGKHYHFVSPHIFEKMVDNGEFLQYSNFKDNYYGTSKNHIDSCDVFICLPSKINHFLKFTDFKWILVLLTAPPDIIESRLIDRNMSKDSISTRINRDNDIFDNYNHDGIIIDTHRFNINQCINIIMTVYEN